MASNSHTTTDHDEIRRWVEERNGTPATVKGTASRGQDAGLLRVDFPGYGGDDSLEEISWDEFFAKFDESSLAFLYQDDSDDGKQSRFSKFVEAGKGDRRKN